MLISILALTALMAVQDPAPAAPPTEAEMAADLHARAVHRCETTPRGQDETVQACADRRVAALMGTYGSTIRALGATAGWLPSDDAPDVGALGFPTLSQEAIDRGFQLDARPPARDRTYRPPQPRCRRETTRSEDGSSSSAMLICGNGGAAEEAARRALGDVMRD